MSLSCPQKQLRKGIRSVNIVRRPDLNITDCRIAAEKHKPETRVYGRLKPEFRGCNKDRVSRVRVFFETWVSIPMCDGSKEKCLRIFQGNKSHYP